jgi:hypothetical protein
MDEFSVTQEDDGHTAASDHRDDPPAYETLQFSNSTMSRENLRSSNR